MATVLPRRHGPRVSLLDMVYGTVPVEKKEPKAAPVKRKPAKKTAKPASVKTGKTKRK